MDKGPSKTYLIIYLIIVIILTIITLIVYYYYYYKPLQETTKTIERSGFKINQAIKSGCEIAVANKDKAFIGVKIIPKSVIDRCNEVLAS